MGRMTVAELIAMLEEFPEEAEIRMAQQPRWAFEYSIQGIASLKEAKRQQARDEFYASCEEDGIDPDSEEARAAWRETEAAIEAEEEVVYLTEGQQLGYLPVQSDRVFEQGW